MINSYYPQSAKMSPDIRNGSTRLMESAYEWEYIRMCQRGEVSDFFKAS